ncbi:MAG TPA: ABC transporter permease [Reyranella sp.]|nr:ABC transporter permease [Reyranella sp.]
MRRPLLVACGSVLLLFVVLALLSPWLTGDPAALNPLRRLRPPSAAQWFGTDHVGRSVFDRALRGTRVSLGVGFAVALTTTVVGVLIGVVAGYFRLADTLIMRAMDAVMAIPAVLLAIALVALVGSSPLVIVTAISVPEIPRMARMVRASVLVLREQAYVEAAITCGGRVHTILLRHILPAAAGPILVQASYVFASAMILEAILSFLGAGTPPDVPSWGNMMAEGRQFLQIAPWILAFPALGLALVVLAVNLLGDAARDMLDPSLARTTGEGGV